MENNQPVFTKVTFGSVHQKEALQGRIWLPGTKTEILAQLKSKGFEVITSRPSRAAEKPVKTPKVKKASKAKKVVRKAPAPASEAVPA